MQLQGSIVALVTPFTADGKIDFESIKGLVDMHLAGGTDAILVNGTTAESPCLSDEESLEIFQQVKEQVAGRIPVLYGSGSNSTHHTISKSRAGEAAGAAALLLVTPYYNKPTQEGLYRHFRAIAEAVSIPVILYNVPGRTGVNLEANTVYRLSDIDQVTMVKEASGNLMQIQAIKRLCGENIAIFSGDDGLNLPIMSLGARGIISVTANVVPERMKKFTDAALAGDFSQARTIHDECFALHRDLFLESNPICVKTALYLMNKLELAFRPPVCELSPQNLAKLRGTLQEMKLI